MRCDLWRSKLVTVGFILCVSAALALAGSAQASSLPPPSGDWIIEAAETVTMAGQDLTLPGNVYVYGHLTLTNCTLRFAPASYREKGLQNWGVVDAADTVVTSTTEYATYVGGYGTSQSNYTRCVLDPVYGRFLDQSVNTVTDCEFAGGIWTGFYGDSQNTLVNTVFYTLAMLYGNSTNVADGCEFRYSSSCGGFASENSQNAFTDCVFNGFVFRSPSVNTLQFCDFLDDPVDYSRGIVYLVPEADTTLAIADLAPGFQAATTIQSSTNPFRVALQDCTVDYFSILTHANAVLSLDNCDLEELGCFDHTETTVSDTVVESLFVWTTAHQLMGGGSAGSCAYATSPVNLTVQDFHDGVIQTVAVTSDNSPFGLYLVDSFINSSYWHFGDNGGATSSSTLIENSSFRVALSHDNAYVLARNSTLIGGVGSYGIPADNCDFVAEDCELTWLELDGATPQALLRRSEVVGSIFFWGSYWLGYPSDPPARSPVLAFDDARLGPGDPRVWVKRGVSGARIEGTVEVLPLWRVAEWGLGSTIIRSFPVFVRGADHQPIAGATVRVGDAHENVVWSGPTDVYGYAYPEVVFDDTNYQQEFRVSAWGAGGADSVPLSFLSSTPILLYPGMHPVSYTSFEQERHPWSTFAAGTGDATTWRQLGHAVTYAGEIAPPAHSGNYEMLSDVSGEGVTGLKLDLPVTPSWPVEYTLRAWTYVDERTANTSAFFGFSLADSYPSPTSAWTAAVGYEALSETAGRLRLGDSSVSIGVGLSVGEWHVVKVRYNRVADLLTVWVDGEPVPEQTTDPEASGPTHGILGVWGQLPGAGIEVCFDDVEMTLGGAVPDPLPAHVFANLEGPEKPVEGNRTHYTIRYGNGYPMLGVAPSPGDDSGVPMYLALMSPPELEFLAATPAPDRLVNGRPVWEVGIPYLYEENYIYVEARTPTGTQTGLLPSLSLWATTDIGGASSAPPYPPDPQDPSDPVWGTPADVLPQYVVPLADLLPDIWVTKEGPAFASPGDTLNYVISVGNGGYIEVNDVTVRDLLPDELGGGMSIVANLDRLEPGEVWRGVLSGEMAWGIPEGTLVLNQAFVPSGPGELDPYNNIGPWYTSVQAASDPNQITVSPTGGIEPGEILTYTIECENYGLGTAYGVYGTMVLDPMLDGGTLTLPGGMSYDPTSRTIVWEVGTVAPGGTASSSFQVQVLATAPRARPIAGQAIIYFPSVPETTPTNIVVNVVNGSFSDLPWDHWAVLPVEVTHENGIVGGYPDGTYQAALAIDRGQMAIYISRALEGCDSDIPDGPETPSFSDVGRGHWGYKYVQYAYTHGIVQGYADGTYRPTDRLDRGQMAVFIARAIAGGDGNVPSGPPAPTFPDVTTDLANPYRVCYDHVEHIAASGVTGGYPDGLYHPEYVVTRGLMGVYVTRAFQLPM